MQISLNILLSTLVVLVTSRPAENDLDKTYLPPVPPESSYLPAETQTQPSVIASDQDAETMFPVNPKITHETDETATEILTNKKQEQDETNANTTPAAPAVGGGAASGGEEEGGEGSAAQEKGNVIPGRARPDFDSRIGAEPKVSKGREGHNLFPSDPSTTFDNNGQDFFQFQTPGQYKYQYRVDYPEHKLLYGHHESRDEEVVTGGYFVVLPDGRKQVVEYTADKNGYHPRIHYEAPNQNYIHDAHLKAGEGGGVKGGVAIPSSALDFGASTNQGPY